MNRSRLLRAALLATLFLASRVLAQQGNVGSTVHNLSVSGPGEIKSVSETEICKFCHIPHNAIVPRPLWGHALSNVSEYEVPELRLKGGRRPAPQPDGSSRLCLSCHDGTVAVADIGKRGGPPEGARLTPDRRGFVGTDLSGTHPISFVVPDGDDPSHEGDMGLRSLAAIRADGEVKLDRNGKLQCTTCHDPHSDQYYEAGRVPHFSVKPSTTEICLVCHEPR
ncbi:MAG TPA: cytochrome c3 family protein [Thermoanaerobaculia bacterium]|nr:cytochrome c3 family protein [Thermoanaerobaculia bacterium]